MQVKAGQIVAFCFCNSDPTTGSGQDPTTPGVATTGALYINKVRQNTTVTLADDAANSAGITTVTYTIPATAVNAAGGTVAVVEGDTVQCIITATVGGISAPSVVRDDHIVVSVWDEIATAHVTAGSFGYYLKRLFGALFWRQTVTPTSRAFYDADSASLLGTQTFGGDGTTVTTVSKEA